jgi:hypothetical protein
MKNRQTVAPSKCLQRWPRHQHFSELSLSYEGHSETLCIHPPNISVKGMFIHTNVAFPESSVLKLGFRLARSGIKIVTRCEVRYCLPGAGLGVEFIDLPPESVRAIEAEIGMASGVHRQSKPVKRRRRAGQ